MQNYFNDKQQEQNNIALSKAKLLQQEQKIGGLTYSIALVAALCANFIFTIVVTAIASKLFPDLPVYDTMGENGSVEQEGAISKLGQFQLYRFSQFAIIPLFLTFVIVAVSFIFKKKPVDLGLKACKPLFPILSVPIFLGLFFGLSWINGLFLKLINYQAPDVMPNLDGGYFWLAVLIIALLPAIVEEIVFRGLVLNGLKGNGTIYASLISGLLFSLFHMNPEQTIYQFICGVIFAYIAIRANSILPTMLLHFLNNFTALLNAKFAFFGTENAWIPENSVWHICIVIFSICLLVGSLALLIYLDRKKIKREQTMQQEQIAPPKWKFFMYSSVGILGAMVMWLSILLVNIANLR